jgi:hypothetical protein
MHNECIDSKQKLNFPVSRRVHLHHMYKILTTSFYHTSMHSKASAAASAFQNTMKNTCVPPLTCSVSGEGAARRQVGGPGGRFTRRRRRVESRLSKGQRESRALPERSACVCVRESCFSAPAAAERIWSDMRVVWCLLLVAAAAGVADAGLALHRRVQCGDHACSENEYCNTQFGNICSACGNVCDFSSHNYNHKDCYENCQGKTTTNNI